MSKVNADADPLFLLGTGLWVRYWWKCIRWIGSRSSRRRGSIWDAFNKNSIIGAVGARVDWIGRTTIGADAIGRRCGPRLKTTM